MMMMMMMMMMWMDGWMDDDGWVGVAFGGWRIWWLITLIQKLIMQRNQDDDEGNWGIW